ncbi:DoxX family protein [Streptosporangium sp. NPDC002524]|uniref:DoxX family protein n=1 Tax=Streptosporangium sp. NPDC002524 TaxID=3154537 RepID=UPI00332F6ADE
MNVVLWIAQSLLAGLFLLAGFTKATQSREGLAARLPWVEDFSDGQIRIIGILEVLAGLGLILPAVTGILPVLVPIAAVGLVITMVGAIAVHLRRKEYPGIAVNVVILLLSAFVAWGRFGPYSF